MLYNKTSMVFLGGIEKVFVELIHYYKYYVIRGKSVMDNNEKRTRRLKKISTEKRDSDFRGEFQRDYGRIIHSPAFRRLQGKSQVFGAGSGDFYRTRLTHTLEVAQIARQLAIRLTEIKEYKDIFERNAGLTIDPLVVECAALAHDLGHPPFGHKGEHDLNEFLKETNQYYEGNAQNFRILMFLEDKYGNVDGLNLTNAVLLAINKYPFSIEKTEKKGLYSTEWSDIDSIRKEWNIPDDKSTLEAQLMDLCDDIAYSTHDIEDGMKAGKIKLNSSFLENVLLIDRLLEEIEKSKEKDSMIWKEYDDNLREFVQETLDEYLGKWKEICRNCSNIESIARQELKSHYVNKFASRVGIIQEDDWYKITFINEDGEEDLVLLREMIILKKLAWITLVHDLRVQRLQKRGEIILKGLWDVFKDEKQAENIIPYEWILRRNRFNVGKDENNCWTWERFVADYIAGMTDMYADKLYGELYGSRLGNIYGE